MSFIVRIYLDWCVWPKISVFTHLQFEILREIIFLVSRFWTQASPFAWSSFKMPQNHKEKSPQQRLIRDMVYVEFVQNNKSLNPICWTKLQKAPKENRICIKEEKNLTWPRFHPEPECAVSKCVSIELSLTGLTSTYQSKSLHVITDKKCAWAHL